MSCPIVLYINNYENEIEIISHRFPEGDASELNRNIKKLFPENIRKKMHNNEDIKQLIEIIKNRVKEDKDIIKTKEENNIDDSSDKTINNEDL